MNKLTTIIFAACCMCPGLSFGAPWSVPGSWQVEQREVRFESDGIQLFGTLHSPAGADNAPAVVVTHGAGPGEQQTPLYQQVTEFFPAIGYSVFVYDRRGAGKSSGERAGASYQDLARDAVAAMRAIAEDPAVDPDRIGFWGLSQGGWIVLEAAVVSEPAFVISLSAPLTTPGRQMEVFAYNSMLIEGFDSGVADRAVELRRVRDGYYRGEIDYDTARDAIADSEDEPWFEHLFLPTSEQLPRDVTSGTWFLEMDYDPTIAFRAVGAPMLFVLGGADPVIPVAETLDVIRELPARDNRRVEVIPGADHLLRIRDAMPAAEVDADPVSDSAAYFFLMGNWLGSLGLDGD